MVSTHVLLIITTTQARNYAYEVNVFSETDNLQVRLIALLGVIVVVSAVFRARRLLACLLVTREMVDPVSTRARARCSLPFTSAMTWQVIRRVELVVPGMA